MVEYLDSRIGKIFKTLKKEGQFENTLIIFTSDNGGMLSGNCWPLKKSKQHLEEGGIRVPCLMQWPKVIPSGTVSAQSSIMMDASVTVLEAGRARKFVPKESKAGWNKPASFPDQVKPKLILPAEALAGGDGTGVRVGTICDKKPFVLGDWKLIRTFKYLRETRNGRAEHKDELVQPKPMTSEKLKT